MSVEDTLVKMATDPQPPPAYAGFLWVSKVQPSAKRAKQLAELALGSQHFPTMGIPKAKSVKCGWDWRGVVYAGRRSRREVAKAGA